MVQVVENRKFISGLTHQLIFTLTKFIGARIRLCELSLALSINLWFQGRHSLRVLRNNRNVGISYPSHPKQIQASLWNGSEWATDEGSRTKINWAYAPFRAHFQKFGINGCSSQTLNINQECSSSNYWWNTNEYRRLNSTHRRQYENVRNYYMHYNYCSDRSKYPIPPQECLYMK